MTQSYIGYEDKERHEGHKERARRTEKDAKKMDNKAEKQLKGFQQEDAA